jgi:hypothetical protein
LVALGGGVREGSRQEVERALHLVGRGPVARVGEERGGLGAGRLALLHGTAQRGLDDPEPRLELAPRFLGGEEFALHERHLLEREGEAVVGGRGLGGAQVALLGQVVEARLVDHLVAAGLGAEVARPDRVHEDDGGGNDSPSHEEGRAGPGGDLGGGPEADEPGVVARPDKEPPLGDPASRAAWSRWARPIFAVLVNVVRPVPPRP